MVFSFPKKAPETSVMRNDIGAIDQLNHYRMVRDHWCEHNPSVTIFVKPDEWLAVGDWIYRNWDDVGGVSFLPYSDHIYKQAPFSEISSEEFHALEEAFPDIDFSVIHRYESDDNTTATHELACVSGVCSIN
jgi:ribonucleoside-diphosphate reductase alpha chain